uniref:Unannotated protein n=1 Tax=freshwater metagenome TaxID=449393 RepID=A0A6J5Z5S3_9ZZZZ
MRHARVALQPGLRIERVEAVADQRQPIRFAPEADQAGGVAWEVDHLEAGNLVALLKRAADLHRPAVPSGQQLRHQLAAERVQQFELEVVLAAVTFGVGNLGRVAEDWRTQGRRRAAVVGVAVPQNHAGNPAELCAGDRKRVGHRTDAGVKQQHAFSVAHEVGVHCLAGEASANDPDSLCDRLGSARCKSAHQLRAGVEGALHPAVRL